VRYAAQLNDVYYLLLLLPWILLCPREWCRYVGAGLIVVAVFWSMKRTAILALLVTLIVYVVTDRVRTRSHFSWYWLVAIGVATYFSFQLYSYVDIQTDRFLSKRIESSFYDRGSGRIDIYSEVFRLLEKSTIDEWMLGHGHNTVRRFNTLQESDFLSAHNDWLEIVFDYGLLALALYLFIHISLLRFTFNLLKQRSFYGPAMAASYTLFLVMSLTSHLVLYASYFGYIMALWGSLCVIAEGVSPPCLIRTRAYGVKRA
jgi:O-antigen ligase